MANRIMELSSALAMVHGERLAGSWGITTLIVSLLLVMPSGSCVGTGAGVAVGGAVSPIAGVVAVGDGGLVLATGMAVGSGVGVAVVLHATIISRTTSSKAPGQRSER